MFISKKLTVIFDLPKEYKQWQEFKNDPMFAQWKEHPSTTGMAYTTETMDTIELEAEDDNRSQPSPVQGEMGIDEESE